MPVIPFPSERVFNSATFLPMLIPLKTLRNFSNLHLKINVRTRACSGTFIARTKQAALTRNVRGKRLKDSLLLRDMTKYDIKYAMKSML